MSQVHPAPGEGAGATAAGDDGAVAITVAPNATEGSTSGTVPATAAPLSVRARAAAALESVPMQIVSMVMTLYALFMFDINAALLPVSAAACRSLQLCCRAALLTRAACRRRSPAPTSACRSS